ncbi:f-actin-capping protein subunit alpha [Caerostris darwini]|uniref:F-actin-capping protein subunit alpha n=1 Tax=Caerostris darwini TaxID=1538125 RepID=A0AAV4QLS1_9ARAC|nr:f-actin-capping protein subunit alpha [Caerostris darwini]
MAPELEEPVTDEEKIRIVSDFILHSPPGEFNEVFNDVRVLINDDFLLKEAASGAFARYNKDQLTPVKIDGSNFFALISDYNDLGCGRFYDPRSQQSFKYDHLRKDAVDFKLWEPEKASEGHRKALEEVCTQYTRDHFKHGTCSVFSSYQDGNITLTACIEDHQFQPKNFWNGRWRSIWSATFAPDSTIAELEGIVKVQVHYYEDGNVQLVTSKEIKESLTVTTERQTAVEFMQIVEEAETEYQKAISENYQTMSDTTFKALRRLLPVTRTKIDWGNILTHKKLDSELKHH